MTKDFNLIKKCLHQIEEKLGWGSSDNWHNDVFIELSKNIHEHTNVLLSPTTLKRVWGKVNYNSNPSINTLNTLAQFSGFKNWRDFKNSFEQTSNAKVRPKYSLPKFKVLGVTIVLAGLVASILIAMRTNDSHLRKQDFTDVTFSSRPITSGLPNTVIFDFDLREIDSDSIYIQQFWDKTKTIRLNDYQSQATGQYYYPGYFRAKLLVDGIIGKEHDLFIKSDGWLGTLDYEPIPKYLDESLILNEHLKLPDNIINEISLLDYPLESSYHYVDDFGDLSGDHFSLETSMRNVYNEKWAVCSVSKIVILGSKGAMVIPFSIPGCVSEIGVMMNDVYLNGKEHDLSMFGTELSEFQDYNIRIEDSEISVSIDGKNIFKGKYNESIGRFVGIRYKFLGAGEVNHLKVRDLRNDSLIVNQFRSGFDF